MHSCVLAQLKPSRRKDEGQLGLKSSIVDLPGGGAAQSTTDGMNVVYKLVRGVMKHPRALQSMALIDTCAEMCRTEGINLAEVLRDPVFEGRTALYWIIRSKLAPDQYGLLSAILNHSGPLSSKAVDEVDKACVIFGNQTLFSHFWRHPAYHGLSGADELSLCGTSPADYVEVKCPTINIRSRGKRVVTNINSGLIVHFEIAQFHKRMDTSGRIVLKFVARGSSTC